MTLGEHLRNLRERKKLKVSQVAKDTGKSRGTPYAWEADRINPAPESLQRLLELYGASDAERLMAWALLAAQPTSPTTA